MTSRSLNRALESPVIVTGRGGSGTRLLSELVAACGLFLGNDMNRSGDSLEWVTDLYALSEASLAADWVSQPPDASAVEQWRGRLVDNARDVLRRADRSPLLPWGWKLPESMLSVPMLLAVFQRARLIHLVRHPVTSSLRRTHRTSRLSNPTGRAVLRAAFLAAGRDPESIEASQEYQRNAITWWYQVSQVTRYAHEHLPAERYLEIRYEDLCQRPEQMRAQIDQFLQGHAHLPTSACEPLSIQSERITHIDKQDARVQEVWALCGSLAQELGYNASGLA